MGLQVVERSIDRTEVLIAEELFLTGTAAQIVAATKVDHRPIGSGGMGPITTKLRALFDDVVRRVEPFFQQGGELNGVRTDFWMARAIGDAYPDLSNEEVHVLAKAVMRYYQAQ